MRYYCPFCREFYDDTNLVIAIDEPNKLLRQHVQDNISNVKMDSLLGPVNELISIWEREMESGIYCYSTEQLSGNEYRIDAFKTVDSLKTAWHTLVTRQKIREKIENSEYLEVDECVGLISAADFDAFEYVRGVNVETHIDSSNRKVLHDAHDQFGAKYPKVCGTCHKATHEHAGEFQEILIGLIGTQRVAKTSLIASILYSFDMDLGIGDIYFSANSRDSRRNAAEKMLEEFKQGKAVSKTLQDTPGYSLCVSVVAHVPLKGVRSNERERLLLTFVDMPGDLLAHKEEGLSDLWFREYKDFFKAVNCFWFCIDLNQLYRTEDVGGLIESGYGMGFAQEDQLSILEQLISPSYLDRALSKVRDNMGKAFPPTAIILTKSDEAENSGLFPDGVPNYIFGDASAAEAGFYDSASHSLLLDGFVDMGMKLRRTLKSLSRSAETIMEILEKLFPSRAYFSTSAYSHSPIMEPDKKPQPFRVKLPLYWTLAVMQKLDISLTNYYSEPVSGLKALFGNSKIPKAHLENVRCSETVTYMEEDGTQRNLFNVLCSRDSK